MEPDFEKYRIGDVFKSRKNRVFRIRTTGEIRVAKVYPRGSADTAQAEYQILADCVNRHVLVPKPLELADNAIVMNYVDGMLVSDVVDSLLAGAKAFHEQTEITLDSLSNGLSDWLASFHVAFDHKLCRGDTILRNFMLSDGRIYGLDFEEAHMGDTILDLGELYAHILGLRPLFSQRNFEFAAKIMKAYWDATGQDRTPEMPEAIAVGLEHYAKFRQDGGVLEAWARTFRKEGAALLEQPGR